MSKLPFLPYHPLLSCSHAFQKAAAFPRHMGKLISGEGMRLVEGTAHNEIDELSLSLLVDEEDGLLADAKFQAFAAPGLIAIAELACANIVRKSYEQVRRINADYLVKLVEKSGTALPSAFYQYVNLVLEALLAAVTQCMDIPVQHEITTSPIDYSSLEEGALPDYENLNDDERIALIKHVLDKDIRPYIELDAGGIEIVSLKNNIELTIAYQGACTTCPSSVGGTLDAITQILRAKVFPHLIVTPDSSFLSDFLRDKTIPPFR